LDVIVAWIFRDFSEIFRVLPRFLINENFGGALAPPSPLPPTPLNQFDRGTVLSTTNNLKQGGFILLAKANLVLR